MDNVATASIKAFGSIPEANQVSPDESVFILTSSQIQDLILQAIQPLHDEIHSMKAHISELEKANETLSENQLIQLKLINSLREATKKEPQPLQKDRSEILRALLVANGGKMLAKDARNKMHLKKNQFSELLTVCDFIEMRPYHLDSRKKIIILSP